MATEQPANLGQTKPAANTLTSGYTVPVGKRAVLSSIVICNLDSRAAHFRIRHALGGAADLASQALYHDEIVPGNKTYVATLGVCLIAGDVLRVYSDSGNLVFNVYGVEVPT